MIPPDASGGVRGYEAALEAINYVIAWLASKLICPLYPPPDPRRMDFLHFRTTQALDLKDVPDVEDFGTVQEILAEYSAIVRTRDEASTQSNL